MTPLTVPQPERLRIIEGCLIEQLGVDAKAIVHDWRYLRGRTAGRADAVSFSDHRRTDADTACHVVAITENGNARQTVGDLAPIGAPFAFLAGPRRVEMWPVPSPEDTAQEASVLLGSSYADLSRKLARHRQELTPDAIVSAKRRAIQLSLWRGVPEFYEYAVRVNERTFTHEVVNAIEVAASDSGYQGDAARLGLLVVGAMILEDKGHFAQMLGPGGFSRSRDAHELADRSRQRYPQHFSEMAEYIGQDSEDPAAAKFVRVVFEELGDVTFRGLTYEMLQRLYERAFLRGSEGRERGIQATSLHLARRIVDTIPAEDIHPELRTILDPCCGSGALLHAACERLVLSGSTPHGLADGARHAPEWAFGIDRDSFASQLAALGALAFAPESHAGVCISNRDVTQASFAPPCAPGVIVAHPPAYEAYGKKKQSAAPFVTRALEWIQPNGYLALVLPISFLSSDTVDDCRALLLRQCHIEEIWEVPDDHEYAIRSSTAVIIARKAPDGRLPLHDAGARIVQVPRSHGAARAFIDRGVPVVSSSVSRFAAAWGGPKGWIPSALVRLWARREHYQRLRGLAAVQNGVKVGSRAPAALHQTVPSGREHVSPFVAAQSVSLHYIDWAGQRAKYVDLDASLDRPRREWTGGRLQGVAAKVLVRASSRARSPWRLVVALDTARLIPDNYVHFVVPEDGRYTAEVLAALLTSRVANAWVWSHDRTSQVNAETLRQMPVPRLSAAERRELTSLVHALAEGCRDPVLRRTDVEHALSAIDSACVKAYRLTTAERALLDRVFADAARPGPRGISFAAPAMEKDLLGDIPSPETIWTVDGKVTRIDLSAAHVCLSLTDSHGYDHDVEGPIPCQLPGWALAPGVLFEADVDRAWLDDPRKMPRFLAVRPIGYGYMTAEQLRQDIWGQPP